MSGYSRTQLFVFGAAVALFLSVVVPAFFRNPKPITAVPNQVRTGPSPFQRNPSFQGNDVQNAQTFTKEKGWAATLAPFYSLGVFAYVIYIMYRIAKKKPTSTTPTQITSPLAAGKSYKRGGNQKTKITSYELDQLERKLTESEKAVERILQTANKVITEVYQQEMEADESDSQLSSDTTVSHNSPYIKKQQKYDSSSTYNTSDESDSAQHYNYEDEYETQSETEDTDSTLDDTCEEDKGPQDSEAIPKRKEKITNFSSAVEDVNAEEASEKCLENSRLQSKGASQENKQLLETTKEVLQAMNEIRTYIKDHK